MALIHWSDALTVRVDTLDDQHRQLVAYINELHDAVRQGTRRRLNCVLQPMRQRHSGLIFSARPANADACHEQRQLAGDRTCRGRQPQEQRPQRDCPDHPYAVAGSL